MFEDILETLNAELDTLHSKRDKCTELMGKVGDEKRKQLEVKYREICQHIDRAALCISILDCTASVEPSPDFTTVRFPLLPKSKENHPDQRGRLL